jgi:DNA-binding NarL/FixJ family response regulator
MRDGRSLPNIAQELRVSEATVKTYVSRLYSKLRVNNRSQALMAAVNLGLLAPAETAAA